MLTRNVIYILSSIFGVGLILLLVLNPVLKAYLEPTLIDAASNPTMGEMLTEKFSFVISMIDMMPYILFFIGVVYLIFISIRREKVNKYG